VVDHLKSDTVQLVINTPLGASSFRDGWAVRTAAVQHNIPCITTLAGAAAAAIEACRGDGDLQVLSLQELHAAKQAV